MADAVAYRYAQGYEQVLEMARQAHQRAMAVSSEPIQPPVSPPERDDRDAARERPDPLTHRVDPHRQYTHNLVAAQYTDPQAYSRNPRLSHRVVGQPEQAAPSLQHRYQPTSHAPESRGARRDASQSPAAPAPAWERAEQCYAQAVEALESRALPAYRRPMTRLTRSPAPKSYEEAFVAAYAGNVQVASGQGRDYVDRERTRTFIVRPSSLAG